MYVLAVAIRWSAMARSIPLVPPITCLISIIFECFQYIFEVFPRVRACQRCSLAILFYRFRTFSMGDRRRCHTNREHRITPFPFYQVSTSVIWCPLRPLNYFLDISRASDSFILGLPIHPVQFGAMVSIQQNCRILFTATGCCVLVCFFLETCSHGSLDFFYILELERPSAMLTFKLSHQEKLSFQNFKCSIHFVLLNKKLMKVCF